MPLEDTRLRYGTVSMVLHWLIALMILGNLCSGFFFAELAPDSMDVSWMVAIHKSTGLTVLVLSVLRLIWRLMHKWPALPSNINPILAALARLTHVVFYIFIIAIPLAGWAMVSASPPNRTTVWYGLFNWPKISYFASLPPPAMHAAHENFATVHAILAYSAVVLLLLHVAGALYHHFVHRDQVLKRMWFGTRITAPIGKPTDAENAAH
jgi:cytochrome b561